MLKKSKEKLLNKEIRRLLRKEYILESQLSQVKYRIKEIYRKLEGE